LAGSSEALSLDTQAEGGRVAGAKLWLLPMVLTSTGLLQKQPRCSYWVAEVQHSISKAITTVQPSFLWKPQSTTTSDHFPVHKAREGHDILQALSHCCQRGRAQI